MQLSVSRCERNRNRIGTSVLCRRSCELRCEVPKFVRQLATKFGSSLHSSQRASQARTVKCYEIECNSLLWVYKSLLTTY